jgi:hypothetical protein
MPLRLQEEKGAAVQIIHAKFCYLVSDDPQRDSQNVFITKRNTVDEGSGSTHALETTTSSNLRSHSSFGMTAFEADYGNRLRRAPM